MNAAVSVIEIFADVRCPFTHVGLRRLVERREASGAHFVLKVRAWPLELVNDAPLDASLIAAEVAELRRQVAPDLFTGFDPDAFPASSLPALGLAAAAYERDRHLGETVSLRLRDALFEQGRDIGERGELAHIADRLGLPRDLADPASVLRDWHEGQTRGVIGSPHFFIGGDSYFCPTLHIEHHHGHLR
ncbi:MAG: disulfide bond formation protein DsbA, partial [Actinobacteria bacterium]